MARDNPITMASRIRMSDLGGLVWRAVAAYCDEHPETTYEEIVYAFSKASMDAAVYLLKQHTPTGGKLPPAT